MELLTVTVYVTGYVFKFTDCWSRLVEHLCARYTSAPLCMWQVKSSISRLADYF